MAVTAGDRQKAISLLEMAAHEAANGNEAVNAIRALSAMRVRIGTFEELFRDQNVRGVPAPHVSFNETRRQNAEIIEARDAAQEEVVRLKASLQKALIERDAAKKEVAALKLSMGKQVISDGSLPFPEFSFRAKSILGVKDWRQEFIRQTGQGVYSLNKAANEGQAPPEMVALLAGLKHAKTPRYTVEQVRDIRRWARTLTDDEIAERANADKALFPTLVTSTSVKQLRSNIKNETAGYSHDVYGKALPVRSLPPVAGEKRESTVSSYRNAPFPWQDFPDLEELICENYVSNDRRSAAEMAKLISEESGIKTKDGPVKQRLNNAPPPQKLVDTIDSTGPVTWLELWYLSTTRIQRRAWLSGLTAYLDLSKLEVGQRISSLPSDKIAKLRTMPPLKEV